MRSEVGLQTEEVMPIGGLTPRVCVFYVPDSLIVRLIYLMRTRDGSLGGCVFVYIALSRVCVFSVYFAVPSCGN